ncbi:MAG: hypothetical protein CMN96_04845 [Synechococcus sp. MED850]|nr:hypothetical protein [Synechococcus sp. MED850]OUW98173.1 MAG: hypothetical protein CBD89_03565 [Cyanobacteria bacterium TMED229]
MDSRASADSNTLEQRPPFWSLKPWWCQPWSILLSGLVLISLSWWFLQRLWITLPLTLAVMGWWALFLVLVPAAYRNEQRSEPS